MLNKDMSVLKLIKIIRERNHLEVILRLEEIMNKFI